MKKFLGLILFAAVLTSCKGEKKGKTIVAEAKKVPTTIVKTSNIDEKSSVLNWKGFKPTGSHNGTVALKSGSIAVENGNLTGGEFVIDMSSITVLDIPADNEGNGKLVGHLSSGDFFDVATYPTSKFVITSVAEEGGKVIITGNLTIKDVTKSVSIPSSVSVQNGVTTIESDKFMVNRADFNVKYGSKSFFDNLKDKFINDDMEFSFVVKTKA
jgi:polyisoprenoid-binding protein YceI